MRQLFAIVLSIFIISGCSSDPQPNNGGTNPEDTAGPNGAKEPKFPPGMAMGTRPIGSAPLPVVRRSTPHDPSLIPGDVLTISVYNEADLALEVRLPDGAQFSFPLIGMVDALGRTPGAVETIIRERLAKDYLVDPQVTVTVKEYALRKVYVLGGVEKPSGYTIEPNERITLLQLISAAGGITDKAYKELVQIVRRGTGNEREVILLSLVDVERAIATGHPEADLELWPEDLVVIPSAARVVYVLGAVTAPGWFDIPSDTRMTASMAISRAGSYTKFASKGSIQVLRQTLTGENKRLEVDLNAIVGGDLSKDVVLEPGDVVWVPERSIF